MTDSEMSDQSQRTVKPEMFASLKFCELAILTDQTHGMGILWNLVNFKI